MKFKYDIISKRTKYFDTRSICLSAKDYDRIKANKTSIIFHVTSSLDSKKSVYILAEDLYSIRKAFFYNKTFYVANWRASKEYKQVCDILNKSEELKSEILQSDEFKNFLATSYIKNIVKNLSIHIYTQSIKSVNIIPTIKNINVINNMLYVTIDIQYNIDFTEYCARHLRLVLFNKLECASNEQYSYSVTFKDITCSLIV